MLIIKKNINHITSIVIFGWKWNIYLVTDKYIDEFNQNQNHNIGIYSNLHDQIVETNKFEFQISNNAKFNV